MEFLFEFDLNNPFDLAFLIVTPISIVVIIISRIQERRAKIKLQEAVLAYIENLNKHLDEIDKKD